MKNWLLAALTLLTLTNTAFILYYITFLNVGIKQGWPDAISCVGRINKDDTVATNVFYLVHHNQNGFAYYRLPTGTSGVPPVVGNAPTISFNQETGAFNKLTDSYGELDCKDKSIHDLMAIDRVVFFITSTAELKLREYFSFFDRIHNIFKLLKIGN